jgi:alanyl-tRNA synthetase
MKTDELRQKYLDFFVSKGHHLQGSDVLVPTWDPSVLFTPAGMNQFKDHFLGKVKLDFTRATTCQKCLRTGDIDNVGRTAYHHTFFEMLGNFSFGDYFKKEAIAWAWEFLTSKQWLGIDPNRLTVTVYKDDDEAAKLWNEMIGLPFTRISRMEEDENFWPASAPSLGPDGVCGPCSEIYYELENGKNVEIWNLVFTQFNRVGEPPNNLRPLPSKNIDTGMGLERTASVLQGKPTNFHIDSLFPIVQAASQVCNVAYEYENDNGRRLRRITDHVRACTFAIHENVYPGPKKARYVIKRLLRRAVLDGYQMGMQGPFLHRLVPVVAEMMKVPYPELMDTVERVSGVMQREEADFFRTIQSAMDRINGVFSDMTSRGKVMVDGREAAGLYQTYGVPPELFQQLSAEKGFTFDWDGYREAMEEHEKISGDEQKELFKTGPIETLKEALRANEFLGYVSTGSESKLKGIILGEGENERLVSKANSSDPGVDHMRIVLDKTPFYGESGGQVGDTGLITSGDAKFEVTDTQKSGDLVVHTGRLKSGTLTEGMPVTATVDSNRRNAIRRAHSATHVLHYALQKTVGGHAQQQGSKVDSDWLRFDFTNQTALREEELEKIEEICNERIQSGESISWKQVSLAEARAAGAMMLFGEKYPDPVRMVSMGEFSRELCGGTHADNTKEIGSLLILSEESISSGTRRITALTGPRAESYLKQIADTASQAASRLGCGVESLPEVASALTQTIRKLKKISAGTQNEALPPVVGSESASAVKLPSSQAIRAAIRQTSRVLNVPAEEIPGRIESLLNDQANLRSQIEGMTGSTTLTSEDLVATGEVVSGVRLIVRRVEGATPLVMRQWIDKIRETSAEPVAILLAAPAEDDKVTLVAGISSDLVKQGRSAGKWIGPVAKVLGGGGGGKPDFAQAGGRDVSKIEEALAEAKRVW